MCPKFSNLLQTGVLEHSKWNHNILNIHIILKLKFVWNESNDTT